jgi:hypothetical protein
MNAARLLWSLKFLAVLIAGSLMLVPTACDSSSKKDKSEKDSDDDEKDDDDDEDDEDDDDDGKKKKKKKGRSLSGGDDADEDKTSRGAVSGPSAGAVLDYMPADCAKGRVYLNTAALLSDAGAQNILREITNKVLSKERDAEAQKAVDVLKKSGFDLATGIREAAMCMDASSDDPVIGMSLSVADPLGLLKKVAAAMGETNLPITEKNGAKILASDDVTFVQPASGILVFGKKALAESSIDKKGGPGFATARGQVAYFHIAIEADSHMEGKITRAASNFNLWGALKMDAKTASQAKSNAKEFEQEMRKTALKESAELKSSPFKLIDDRLQNATFQVKGDQLVATLSIPTTDVTALLKAAAPQFGVQLGSGGTTPQPSSGGQDPLDELLKMMKKK